MERPGVGEAVAEDRARIGHQREGGEAISTARGQRRNQTNVKCPDGTCIDAQWVQRVTGTGAIVDADPIALDGSFEAAPAFGETAVADQVHLAQPGQQPADGLVGGLAESAHRAGGAGRAQLDAGLAEIDLGEVNAPAGRRNGPVAQRALGGARLVDGLVDRHLSVWPTPDDCHHQHCPEERSHDVTV